MQNNRAQIFLPFDALKGFRSIIATKDVVKVNQKELMEDSLEELDYKLSHLKRGQMITVIYYMDGEYIKKNGILSCIDEINKEIVIVKERIKLKNIIKIEE